jgi:hypothetical protein
VSNNGNDETQDNPKIVVEFMPDGNTKLHTAPGIGSAQFWIASRLMELMGDSQFAEAQMLAQASRQKITVPGRIAGMVGKRS